uniref:ATP synthase Fo subunit 8 n=1 Tax=Caridina cf. weberi 6 VDM-2018 TaxID=2493626 RepID=A0A3Q8LZP5_9EUCA|nr:ATP synthase Fo subunit 8 [Caridina cf. weberi 6 VDM-2018]AZH80622.1 ATP synthase Fo subunit 8 [Caridina cf. weberi 6 VDM-2018]
MAPLSWLNLFIFFSVVYVFFLISNYFLKTPEKTQAFAKTLAPNKLNWKW